MKTQRKSRLYLISTSRGLSIHVCLIETSFSLYLENLTKPSSVQRLSLWTSNKRDSLKPLRLKITQASTCHYKKCLLWTNLFLTRGNSTFSIRMRSICALSGQREGSNGTKTVRCAVCKSTTIRTDSRYAQLSRNLTKASHYKTWAEFHKRCRSRSSSKVDFSASATTSGGYTSTTCDGWRRSRPSR